MARATAAEPGALAHDPAAGESGRGRGRRLARVLRNRTAVTALALLLAVVGVSVVGPLLSPHPVDTVQLTLRNQPPGSVGPHGERYLLGADFLGRDVLTRMLYGLRISLVVGFNAILLGSLLGVGLGVVAGFYGGTWDAVIMRLVDIQLSFPTILIAIAWAAFIGPGIVSIVAIIALTSWVEYARVVRGATLSLREQAFVEGAFAVGLPSPLVLLRHVLPNVLSPVIIVATLQLGRAIILESTLSFLGLGIQPPLPSLGSMLADGRRYLDTAWWVATMPGLAIMLLVLCANLLGDSLRDVLDPRHAAGEHRR